MKRISEKGNVLWFILVGIVLLGALTLILSRSGSSVDQSADVEQLRVRAAQIMRYAKGIETAIDQMKIRGVSENDISFQNTVTTTDYTNARCTSVECRLFDPGGAGMAYQPPPPGTNDGSDWIFTGDNNIGSASDPIGTQGAGTGNDLIMLLPDMSEALCIQINRDLDVGSPGELPVDNGGVDISPFQGQYAAALREIDADPSMLLGGHNAGCFIDDTDDTLYFYFVVLAR
jgi:type II secretory pathway pseudopilin PulG